MIERTRLLNNSKYYPSVVKAVRAYGVEEAAQFIEG